MEQKLEVVLSSSIKRKKPWPRFCWLGLEKESVFLLDDKRISEINMVSGRTKKKTPKLQPLLPRVVTMAASQNGVWLAGLLVSGELFLWSRDKDSLKTVAAVPTEAQLVTAAQGSGVCLSLVVSGDGMRVLLVTVTGQVFLWECVDVRDLSGVRDGTARGRWAQIQHPENTALPSPRDKEASQHSIFIRGEAVGDICLSAFVFTSVVELSVTFLKIQWEEGQRSSPVGYSVRWVTKTYPMSCLTPPCRPVKSRGALVPAFSPDGLLLAVALNQRDPRATQVLFVSTQNFVTVSSGLGGCGSKKLVIPSKYVRSYWVGSVSWAVGGLYLACVLKRGSFLMLARLGGLLSLSTSGCNVDFGPAHFLPLHPLVTYRPPVSVGGAGVDPLSSSSLSVRDVLRQRYSVTWHPRLPYLIVSDGYMATVLRVPEQPSPATLLRALLHDTSQGLESASRALERTQPHARAWLESISCLKLSSSLQELRARPTPVPTPTATATSTLPLFLQDQGGLGDTRELVQRVQALFEDDSDLEGLPAGSHVEDRGRLEFASMFDTLHALSDTLADLDPSPRPHPDPDASSVDSERRPPALPPELRGVQGSLMTAWALGVSLGGVVEQRERLLKYTVRYAVRFAALLRLISIPCSHTGRRKKSNIPFSSHLLHLLRTLLSFLPWDAPHTGGRSCLGLVVELTQQLVGLLLSSPPDLSQTGQASSEPSSQTLSTALLLLELTSHSMDHTYSLQQKCAHTDVYCVLFLQEEGGGPGPLQQDLPLPQRPSSRLRGVWRAVYRHTLQYWEELKHHGSGTGWEEEQGRVSVILSQIQTALQGMGERLEDGPTLLSYTGEQHFLFGCYSESAQAWRAELWAERQRDGPRSAFLETRLLLSLLYGLLFQYRLKEAQGLGDHMACLLLHQAGQNGDDRAHNTEEALPGSWLPGEVHSEAACAVVQTLGRFMASYFTNKPLLILPPHSVDVLPPLHLPHAPGVGRLVPLCQERVAGAVRGQQLSEVWTVGYTQDLLLQGGLLPEATWLAHCLGDWKTAASLGLAYTTYAAEHCDFTGLRWRELHLPAALEPVSIFQGQLESLLGRKAGPEETQGDEENYKSFTDSLEGEDVELLQGSVQEILKASVMAGVDVLSQPLGALLDSAKDLSSCLPALVPMGLYLPAPPLYCPQPAPNTQDPSGVFGQLLEGASRHRVSGVLQRVLLLLRSARCSRPAAQWYISHLQRSRHRLHRIRQKYSQQQCVTKAFPEALMKFVTRGGFFRLGPSGAGTLDSVTIQTIICFRELCGLCWMLNVRDQLSMSCRKYQAARNCGRDPQVPADDGEVTAACEEALHWACRFLPFSRFLNAEEILQDTLLSLVSELPPVPLVAETLVQAFPEEEESVRVPLREKYNSLLQRLRHCTVPASGQNGRKRDEEEGEEMMMILMQERLRQRRKDLKRLARHLAPLELYLWEREEEEDRGGGGQGAAALLERFSLGASLSNSTLTDCGRPLVYSDGDTAENSVALSPDLHSRLPHSSSKRVRVLDRADKSGRKVVEGESIQEEGQSCTGPAQDPAVGEDSPSLTLPVVGTWEFELEDEEYLRFLELFFSYVLEKDGPDPDSGCDPPLLKGFCSQLRERELHSLTFDVLTTLRRRQRDGRYATRRQGGSDAPVFRAGHCYKPVLVTTPSFLHSEPPTPRPSMSVSVLSLPGLRTGRQQGLFGFSLQASPAPEPTPQRGRLGSEPSPSQSSVPWEQPSECWAFGPLGSVETVELQQELEPKLEAQFPGLGRLLEWMVRWADKRVLLGHPSRMKGREAGGGGVAGGGVVIRVKATAPAVLTALSMLEHRYTAALLGMDRYCANLPVPERQWTVAPVLQPEVGWKLERESSVDTGYPASAGTPITLPEQDPQHSELSYGSQTEGMERVTSQETSHLYDHEGVTLNPESGVADFRDHKLDLSAEKEGDDSNADKALRSSASLPIPNISVHIKSLHRTLSPQDQSLTLADLQCSESEEDSVSSQEEEAEILLSHGSLRRPSSDITEEVTRNIPPSEGSGSDVPPQFSFQPLPMAGPQAGAQAADSAPNGGLPQRSINTTPTPASAPNQALSAQTDPVRQLLQDELFRLVQLQQINFMSLMQVVGASFVNLPLSQNNTLLAQSNVPYPNPNAPLSHPNTLLSHPNLILSQNNMSPMPQTQASFPVPAEQPVPQNSVQATLASEPLSRRDRPTDQPPIQEMQPLAVHPEPLRDIQGETRTSSHGLQTPVDPTRSAPLLLPSGGSSQDPAPYSSGLKLLQLHPPLLSLQRHGNTAPVREAWGPPSERRPSTTVPPHLNPSQYDPAALRRAEERRREAESESTAPPSHLNLTQYAHYLPDQVPRSTLPQRQNPEARVERSRGAEPPHLPPTLPSHRPPPVQGLPLLRFHPDPRPHTTFPLIPLPYSSRPLTVTPAAKGHNPGLQLLQRDPDPPRMMLPEANPPAPVPRLIPLGELMGWAAGRERGADPRLQLLRVDPQTQNPTPAPATPSTSTNSSKRQKRRVERLRREGEKAEVTFRLEDSIIPPQESNEDEPAEPVLGEGYVFPLGTFDSMLTGQRLVDRALSTTAELHAFASTHKRPPESHDACTNTDPASPHSDKGISAQPAVTSAASGPAALPPELFLNRWFPRDPPVQDIETPGETQAERNTGRQFINVIDLEDGALLQELPSCPRPAVWDQDVTPSQPSPPTSAQLHLLAASVTNSAPPELTADTSTEDDQPQAQPGFSVASLPPAHPEPNGDPVTRSLLQERRAPGRALETRSPGTHRGAPSRAPVIQVSARLSEIDAQLAALQNIADHMEREFANTRLLVRTIETLGPAMAPEMVEGRTPLNKTVTLAVSPEGWRSRLSVHHDTELAGRQQEEEEGRDSVIVSSAPWGVKQPFSLSPAVQSTSTLHPPTGLQLSPVRPEPEQRVWDISQDLTDNMDGAPGKWAEETLGLSGLSDVADILAELVREGGISPTALGLSHTQAARLNSRLDQQQSGRAGQRGMRAEEERRELRVWMRRKQREKLVEYRRQREEKRERERKPFSAPVTVKPTSKDININKKIKEEKDKMVLLEHHNQRARDACSLITDLLTTPLTLPTNANHTMTLPSTSPRPTSTRPLTAQTVGSTRSSPRGRSLSVGGKRKTSTKSQTGRARSLSSPGVTPRSQRRPASSGGQETLSARLGLHRPASFLPRDRLSQVTRRGMITDLRGRTGPKTPSQQEWRREVSQSPPGWRGGGAREQRETEEREEEVVSPWNPPPEICRLLGLENSEGQGGAVARAGGAGLDILDTLSESTGSILSQLDWAAIESIVAAEGAI
ncbi:ciliogenesis and planar polarity effector 1 isoform X1 [Coregonus clupeaformis]|uniref:ciliogenesis and planar polarity effector 1 isoform X1 n=1 Tax=Coregonus clupeaformis TaxID=59861 RepID=UPI001E1C74E3|nr:ciliogenesis and planar polarity effector 1 isoform X1 [Coregonus clupeaformis]